MKDQLTKILNEKSTIVEDFTNCNGRFVTVLVENPRLTAYELSQELPVDFPEGHTSKPSYWGPNEYEVQFNSKRPAFLHPGCTYPIGAFGDMTKITVKRG